MGSEKEKIKSVLWKNTAAGGRREMEERENGAGLRGGGGEGGN